MKHTLLTAIFTAGWLISTGQNSIITGTITGTDSTSSLPGVSVYLEGTSFGAVSNGNGHYIIKNVAPGDYTLVSSIIGYHTNKKKISIKSDETINSDFLLYESVLDLPAVVIQSATLTGGNSGVNSIQGSAHYISPKELQRFSYTDVNRTLRSVPGINLQEEDGFGLRPNIGLRGTGVERSSKITIMEDGVLMSPAPYSSPAAYYFPTIGRMQAVEVLKGSSQIKYGPFTTGGAINLISTQIPSEFSGRVHLLGGSFGGRNIHANAGNSNKNFSYLVETFQYGSDGFKKLDDGGNTGFDKKDFMIKMRVNTNAEAKIYQSLTLKTAITNETSNETYLGLTESDFSATPLRRYAGSQKDVMLSEQMQFSATHVLQFNKLFDVTTTAYRTEFARNWYKLDKVKDSTGTKTSIANLLSSPEKYNNAFDILTGSTSTNDDALFVKANNRSYYAQGLQTVLGFNFKTNALSHKIDLGLRYHYDQMDRYQHEDQYKMNSGTMMLTKAGKPGTESNSIESAKAIAGYIQYKVMYKNLTVVPGIRYENIMLRKKDYGKTDPDRTGVNLKERDNAIDVFIPGIGIDYKFTKLISAFAGIHKGFAPPGSKTDTKPEESANYETGLRYSGNGLSGQIIGFYNNYKNLLGSDLAAAGGGGTGELFNGGKAESKGLELQATYDILSSKKTSYNLPFSVVYTYTNALFKSDFTADFEDWGTVKKGDEMPYLANNQFTIMLSLEHRLFSFNLSGRYMDAMRTQAGQGNVSENEMTDSYFIFDASASYMLHQHFALFANATNLTDAVYAVAQRPSGFRSGMPRAFNIGVKANF